MRDRHQARDLARTVNAHPALRLIGVAGYEGVAGHDRGTATLDAVDEHCRRVADIFVANAGLYECDRPMLSMGGSVFPDRVVAARPEPGRVAGAVNLLRCGCYVTHDHGVYAKTGPPLGFRAAATVQAVVLSVPESDVAVVGAGKRELPHDAGMPTVLSATDRYGQVRPAAGGTVSAMYDHHTVVTAATGLQVSDVVEFGISHPCSLFARWGRFGVTRDGSDVDTWTTQFHHADPPES